LVIIPIAILANIHYDIYRNKATMFVIILSLTSKQL